MLILMFFMLKDVIFMSKALIIPKYKISKSLYSKLLTDKTTPTNYIEYDSSIVLKHLSGLNKAGNFNIEKSDILSSRITITPDYGSFVLMVIDKCGTAYFVSYDLNNIASLIDDNEDDVLNLENVDYFSKFMIKNFSSLVGSFQGFGIDNRFNIYIASEYPPTVSNYFSHDRKIIKISWNSTDPSEWRILDMLDDTILDHEHCTTEFKSIQVISEDHIFLTVSYYSLKIDKHFIRSIVPVCNRVFEVRWCSDPDII